MGVEFEVPEISCNCRRAYYVLPSSCWRFYIISSSGFNKIAYGIKKQEEMEKRMKHLSSKTDALYISAPFIACRGNSFSYTPVKILLSHFLTYTIIENYT